MNKKIAVIVLLAAAGALFGAMLAMYSPPPLPETTQAEDSGAKAETLAASSKAEGELLVQQEDAIEQEIEREIWNSARQLRQQRSDLAASLKKHLAAQKQRRKSGGPGQSLGSLPTLIALEKASLRRIDDRLRALARRSFRASRE
ncbi:MAG TPA: hypothetical protein VGR96_13585 [Acidobacteriaceae bacterium]|nr:hypothetical protein [Acidobacteriaceae bacterium]